METYDVRRICPNCEKIIIITAEKGIKITEYLEKQETLCDYCGIKYNG